MLHNIGIWTEGYLWGTLMAPVEAYVIYRFGGALWQDIKLVAYNVWDKVKSYGK